jgi:hypothetical protein
MGNHHVGADCVRPSSIPPAWGALHLGRPQSASTNYPYRWLTPPRHEWTGLATKEDRLTGLDFRLTLWL